MSLELGEGWYNPELPTMPCLLLRAAAPPPASASGPSAGLAPFFAPGWVGPLACLVPSRSPACCS